MDPAVTGGFLANPAAAAASAAAAAAGGQVGGAGDWSSSSLHHYAAYRASTSSGHINSLSRNLTDGVPWLLAAAANGTLSLSHLSLLSNASVTEVIFGIQSLALASLARQYLYNDFFAGGVCLMLLGYVGQLLRRWWARLAEVVASWKRGPVELAIAPDSEAFAWVQDWLVGFAKTSSSQFSLKCKWKGDQSMDPYGNPDPTRGSDPDDRPVLQLYPRLQQAQEIRFRGNKIWFQLRRSQGPSLGDGGGGGGGGGRDGGGDGAGGGGDLSALLRAASKEELVLSGPSKAALEEVVQAAMQAHFEKEAASRTTHIWRWSCDDFYWMQLASKSARPVDSVVLEKDPSALVEDARRFLSSADWYNSRGIPHRRGYLLYGPPGCGKTSLIRALAGELNLDVSLISLSAKQLNDDMLHNAMNRGHIRSIFVLEDVDAAFTCTREAGGDKLNTLSFSGLLNAIDGISAQEGRIVVMTTNHIDRLDPALIRPGRIDMRLYLGLATQDQACRLFRKFFPTATEEQADRFHEEMVGGAISPASLQGFFLQHREDAEAAVAGLPAFLADEIARKQQQDQKEEEGTRKKATKSGSDDGVKSSSGSTPGPPSPPVREGAEVGRLSPADDEGFRAAVAKAVEALSEGKGSYARASTKAGCEGDEIGKPPYLNEEDERQGSGTKSEPDEAEPLLINSP